MTLCPCCGHPLTGRVPVEALRDVPMSAQTRRIVEKLAVSYPRGATIEHLVNHLYSLDPGGGPDDAAGVVRQLVHRARDVLPDYGWTIPKANRGRGNKGIYQLEPLPIGDEP